MKLREVATPVTLIALAAGAAAYTYFVDRGTVSDSDRAARRRDVFPSFRVEDVTRIELARPDESLVLEHEGDAGGSGSAWSMASPRPGPADPGAVETLLRELELATRVRDVDSGVATGLEAPRVRGVVAMGSLVLRFALGADAPRPEGAAYMRVDGEGTFVVGRSLRTQLLRGADAYRPRALVPYGISEVARLEITGPAGARVALGRHGPGFRLEGEEVRAGREAVDHLFTALAEARVETFLDDGVADRLLATGASTLTLTPREARRPPVTVRFGGECPGQPTDVVAVRTSPSRLSACVARALAEALAVERPALIDTSPLYAHSDELEDVRLDDLAGGARVELARRGSGWRERAPEEHDLGAEESDSASILAAAIASVRASEVREASAKAAEHAFVARARVTVVRTGGSVTEIVELAAPSEGGTTWARRQDDGALLRLATADARRLLPHPAALRARTLWRSPPDPGDVRAVDATCGTVPERLEWQGGAWKLKAPAGFDADALATSNLVAAFARAKADAWLTESDDGTFGLGDPGACKVTLSVAGEADAERRSLSLVLGAEAPGGFYARTSDDPAVFVAPAILRSLASRPVLDHAPLTVHAADVGEVAVVREGRRHAVDLGSDAGARVLEAVASLVVRAAVHAGRAQPGEGFDHPALELALRGRAGTGPETRLVFGAGTHLDGVEGTFARAAGLDATFVVLRAGFDALHAAADAVP